MKLQKRIIEPFLGEIEVVCESIRGDSSERFREAGESFQQEEEDFNGVEMVEKSFVLQLAKP